MVYHMQPESTSGMISYNKDIFAENSIEIPTTFSELLAACEKLQGAGVTPFELDF